MSKKWFCLVFLALGFSLSGQPVVNLYGFSRIEKPGMVTERDPSKPAKKPDTTYYLYLSSPASILPNEIWIKGHNYLVQSSPPVKTPVTINGSKILIPFTKNQVRELKWNIQPRKRSTPGWLLSMTRNNELVVAYTWKGKKYFRSLKKFTVLETLFAE